MLGSSCANFHWDDPRCDPCHCNGSSGPLRRDGFHTPRRLHARKQMEPHYFRWRFCRRHSAVQIAFLCGCPWAWLRDESGTFLCSSIPRLGAVLQRCQCVFRHTHGPRLGERSSTVWHSPALVSMKRGSILALRWVYRVHQEGEGTRGLHHVLQGIRRRRLMENSIASSRTARLSCTFMV